MDRREIIETPIWRLYEKGQNYHRMMGYYVDTDRNYRMYDGNQWEGADLGGIEPIQQNFIRSIVNYKCAVVHDNLYAINYSSLNFENQEFRKAAEHYCDLLNGYAARVWERDKLDHKGRRITKDAAVNDEGAMYVDFDEEKMTPVNEIIDKADIYYGNENDDDIQSQPYILIRKRLPVTNAIDLALSLGCSEADTRNIMGDNDNSEEAGESAKYEVDDMVTVIYKFYKKNGSVHFSAASKYVTFSEDNDMGISLYPIAHMVWTEKKGSARGEGEVRHLIPAQLEVNRTMMRRALVAKLEAYPKTVIAEDRFANPSAINQVGAILKVTGNTVEDVHKYVGVVPPAQMSPDVKLLFDDLINVTRDLAGAGDTATGQVDPEAASGRAILAVQQASQAPMTEQRESYKNFVEDLARIWLEYLIAHAVNGVNMEEEFTDPATGEDGVRLVNVPQTALRELQATVKIDITPKSVYDKFAQEQTIENLFVNGLLAPNRVGELEIYAELLDDDSVAPKLKIKEAVERIKEAKLKVEMINSQAQMMQQRANMFLMGDPDEQASLMADAAMQAQAQQMPVEEEFTDEDFDEEAYEGLEETEEE